MTELEDLIHLPEREIKAIHDLIVESGSGLQGSRPDLSVEALIGRIHSNLFYQIFHVIEEVAALYAEVIAKGHVFNDGNKRTAVAGMLTFLDVNGYRLVVNKTDVALVIAKAVELGLIYLAGYEPQEVRGRGGLELHHNRGFGNRRIAYEQAVLNRIIIQ